MTKQIWFFVAIFLVTCLVRDNNFFWDTVQLASKQGHYIYETGFQSFILPIEIDSGHPPLFGTYLAVVWKLFGKTLPASHFAMLPFLFGIIFLLFQVGAKLVGKQLAPWLCLLCFSDPVLGSQALLISPDIVLICFFLMAVWSIWEKKWGLLGLSIAVLSLISMRGMMLCMAAYAFAIFVDEGRFSLRNCHRRFVPFLPGVLVSSTFLAYHWQQTGWIGHHATSAWAPSFETVDVLGFAKNILVLGWRCLDFGRLFVWIALILLVMFGYKKAGSLKWKINRRNKTWQLMALLIFVFMATVPLQLFYKGLLAHRYLLPFFVVLNILTFYLLERFSPQFKAKWVQKWAKPFLIIGLAVGNYWIYPPNISMGWDSTLAHLPWYGLQQQAQQYVIENDIPFETVGTAFPNIGPRKFYDLSKESRGFAEKDLMRNCYVFYSNIMNDFTEEEADVLRKHWKAVFTRKVGGITVILFQNPNLTSCEN
jgi:hypothetical protein